MADENFTLCDLRCFPNDSSKQAFLVLWWGLGDGSLNMVTSNMCTFELNVGSVPVDFYECNIISGYCRKF